MWDAIKDFKPKQHESVGWAWNTNVGKWYGVKEVYHSFFEEEGIDKEDFYQQLWKLKIPSKIKGFIWRVSHDRIQTMENSLERRIIQMDSNINCVFSNECVESPQHLLFECRFAHYIWLSCYQWFGDTIECYHHHAFPTFGNIGGWSRTQGKISLVGVWTSIVWSIWLHRNDIRFNAKPIDLDLLMEVIWYRAWLWRKTSLADFDVPLYGWKIDVPENLMHIM